MESKKVLGRSLAVWTLSVARFQIVTSIILVVALLILEIILVVEIVQDRAIYLEIEKYLSVPVAILIIHFSLVLFIGVQLLLGQREKDVRKLKVWLWHRVIVTIVGLGLSGAMAYLAVVDSVWELGVIGISSFVYDLTILWLINAYRIELETNESCSVIPFVTTPLVHSSDSDPQEKT